MDRALIYNLDELMLTAEDVRDLLQMTITKLTDALAIADDVVATGSRPQARTLFSILRDASSGLDTAVQELDYAINEIG